MMKNKPKLHPRLVKNMIRNCEDMLEKDATEINEFSTHYIFYNEEEQKNIAVKCIKKVINMMYVGGFLNFLKDEDEKHVRYVDKGFRKQ